MWLSNEKIGLMQMDEVQGSWFMVHGSGFTVQITLNGEPWPAAGQALNPDRLFFFRGRLGQRFIGRVKGRRRFKRFEFLLPVFVL